MKNELKSVSSRRDNGSAAEIKRKLEKVEVRGLLTAKATARGCSKQAKECVFGFKVTLRQNWRGMNKIQKHSTSEQRVGVNFNTNYSKVTRTQY